MTALTREAFIVLLNTNDKAVIRALIVLNERQTEDERQIEATRVNNGKGFKPCHARKGTSMVKWFEKTGFLTPKQIAYWRKLDKKGVPRIGCYANQLIEIAKQNRSV